MSNTQRPLGLANATSWFYPRGVAPTLIFLATRGMLAEDDLLLPEDGAARMLREILRAEGVDLEGTNHKSILFQPSGKRDRAFLDFLGRTP